MKAIAAVHVGLKQLGIDDQTGRDIYERVTGKRSLAAMTELEVNRVVQELRDKGFKPSSKARPKALEGRFAKKLQALWIAAWNLGLLTNRSDEALIAFVKRQTGIDHVRFLRDADDAGKAIEALKAWMARAAGVQWSEHFDTEWLKTDGGKIAAAQWRYLEGVKATGGMSFTSIVQLATLRTSFPDLDRITPVEWIAVMNNLGVRIREARRS